MTKTKVTLTLTALAALLLMTGCSSVDSIYDREVTEIPGAITGTNTTHVTNTVLVAEAQTNAVTGEVTPPVFKETVTPVVTYDYAPARYVTNLVARPLVGGAVQAVGALPLPFA